MHAKSPTRFASPGLVAADLRLDERARTVYMQVTSRVDVRRALVKRQSTWYRMRRREQGSRPLTALGQQVIDLCNAGAPEADARQLAIYIDSVIADCYTGNRHRTFNEVDLEEEMLDGREDYLTMRRRVEGETPELLREAIDIDRREGAVQFERARLAERRLRQLERESVS